LIFFILFFLISLILFKFSFKYRNHPSPLYFPLIILIILPHSFKKEDYVKNISLANFYFSQGDFKRVIKYTPSEPSFYYLKGISYFKKGKYDSAQIYLSKHLDIKPLDEEIYFYYTFSLINSGEITSAYRINKRAFKLFSCRPQILLQKGIIFLNMGFLDNAEKYLKKALHTGFERGITYFYLGMVYLKKREFKKADFYLQKALELEPNNEFVKKLLKSISEY
jgi:tetratricopeptide (TPR) repeat protein